jgi:hypothetical protein
VELRERRRGLFIGRVMRWGEPWGGGRGVVGRRASRAPLMAFGRLRASRGGARAARTTRRLGHVHMGEVRPLCASQLGGEVGRCDVAARGLCGSAGEAVVLCGQAKHREAVASLGGAWNACCARAACGQAARAGRQRRAAWRAARPRGARAHAWIGRASRR